MNADQYGVFFDTIYIMLADSVVISVGSRDPIPGDLPVDTDLMLNLNELARFDRMGSPNPGSSAFDILLGVRQVDMDLNLYITLPGPGTTRVNRSVKVSATDIIVRAYMVG